MKSRLVFIIGCHGELGSNLVKKATGKYKVIGIGRDDKKLINNVDYEYIKINIFNRKELKELFKQYHPRFVINSVAMIDIDKCEMEKETCWKINVEAVQNLLYSSKFVDANFIHISTDYIFDGKNGPYNEESRPNPVNYYGKSKLAAENFVISSELEYSIIRTTSLYSANNIKGRKNFVVKLFEDLSKGNKVKVVKREIRNPTFTPNLADCIWKLINLEKSGVYNIAGKDIIDRYNYMLEFSRFFGFDENLIEAVSADDFPNRVPRPENCGLLVDKAEKKLYLNLFGIKKGFELFQEQLKI